MSSVERRSWLFSDKNKMNSQLLSSRPGIDFVTCQKKQRAPKTGPSLAQDQPRPPQDLPRHPPTPPESSPRSLSPAKTATRPPQDRPRQPQDSPRPSGNHPETAPNPKGQPEKLEGGGGARALHVLDNWFKVIISNKSMSILSVCCLCVCSA